MDQSLFAAPHGLSQRITSFIACACQGIHQMPLRHLIVLIANAHRLVAPEGRRRTRLPFTTPSTQQCHRRVRHNPIAGTPVHCEVMSLRPASRDLSDDARSGNINPASSVRDFFARARQDLAILRSAGAPNDWRRASALPINGQQQQCLRASFLPTSNPSTISGRLGHPWVHQDWARTSCPTFRSNKTPGSFQTYLLFTMYAEHASAKANAKLLFLQKISSSLSSTPSELVELSGIEPLTPCLQSRCSPS
jgi:hypothetical protein